MCKGIHGQLYGQLGKYHIAGKDTAPRFAFSKNKLVGQHAAMRCSPNKVPSLDCVLALMNCSLLCFRWRGFLAPRSNSYRGRQCVLVVAVVVVVAAEAATQLDAVQPRVVANASQ